MSATIGGKTDVVTDLIALGADADIENPYGESALILAARYGLRDIVVELVKAGANLELQNKNGDTAVIKATIGYEPDILRELVRAGSDLNLQNQEGLTPLMIAVRSERTDITNILLEGKHINLDIQENRTGWSALHFSAERGNSATTEALLKAGANAQLKDNGGLTALEIAEVKAAEKESYLFICNGPDYTSLISLLKENIAKESPTLPSQQGSSVGGSFSTQQDRSPVHQDTSPTPPHMEPTTLSKTVEDTETEEKESDQGTTDTQQDIDAAHRRGRTQEALRNLVTRPVQIAKQIFNDLDKRLKSVDKKDQPEVIGQGSLDKEKRKTKTRESLLTIRPLMTHRKFHNLFSDFMQ
ncbi:Putative ankyrin repeat protein MM_0045 [Geodia barretti]|nr:Putative ankyrin repeat protein MM_0045 [Geodia barretti]